MKLLKYEKRNSYKGEVVDFDIELEEGVYTTVTYDEVENQMTVWPFDAGQSRGREEEIKWFLIPIIKKLKKEKKI